ncbi:type II secretion system minor pseudopilin GspJ [Brevundimonas terrae]|uniref:Type II secretion system protein J n=1 Tax=Brevundimonas terrae TaxID=363631 RepID=A0ABN0YK06_9CAUL|nr:type II secretion system minor pseudopilin GspJ [Brevundimonas terrae]NIJ27437.1 general secretion pathway protein J [Brevundimonas terrae]
MQHSPRQSREGFTLVEVMIALAVFALISAAGVLVLSQVVDARFAIKGHAARLAEFQRTTAMLKSDVSQMTARRTRGVSGRPFSAPVMTGQSADAPLLTLVRAGWSNPESDARPSLQKVEYRLVENRLERRTYRHLDGGAPNPAQVLYRGVSDVRVTLIQGQSEGPGYLSSTERPLPDAVRIRMVLEGYGPVEMLLLVTGG